MTKNAGRDISCEARPLILVADDDGDTRELITDELNNKGLSCVAASSVAEAIAVINAQEISLAVLDWRLDRSGAEVIRECRRLSPMMPVVVISGQPQDARTDAMVELADAFLQKPLSMTVLSSQVMRLLERVAKTPKAILPERQEDILPLEELKEEYIRHVVQLLGGNLSLAAARLSIHRQTVATAVNNRSFGKSKRASQSRRASKKP